MPERVVALGDPEARDPARVGAKAAALAAAYDAGLPVLPGAVVPVSESAAVVRAAAQEIAHGRNVRARLAAMTVQPDPALVAELRQRVAGYAVPLIVRSSSPLEGDGTWSGAFSSFHGIASDDLATAVRGCWGSAFSMGVLHRARATDTPAECLGLAVLVQPELRPDLGGTARLLADGSVEIASTRGSLVPLMEGQVEGTMSRVDPVGTVSAGAGVAPGVASEVAVLVRRVEEVLGHRLIEWASAAGSVHLLQSLRSPELASAPAEPGDAEPALRSPVALRVMRLVQRFPGRLGYELVLPWAVAAADGLPEAAPSDLPPGAAWAVARRESEALVADVWGGAQEHASVLRGLRSGEVAVSLDRLDRLDAPDPGRVSAVLAHLESVRRSLTGLDEQAFWRLPPEMVDRAASGFAVPDRTRPGADEWEPFVHRVVRAAGTSYDGTPVVPGHGAGRGYFAGHTAEPPRGRYVIVAGEAARSLAPLLWEAAGLVTRAGSAASHLVEFARSIGVPTVVGCPIAQRGPVPAAYVAVDGDRGSVSVLDEPSPG